MSKEDYLYFISRIVDDHNNINCSSCIDCEGCVNCVGCIKCNCCYDCNNL